MKQKLLILIIIMGVVLFVVFYLKTNNQPASDNTPSPLPKPSQSSNDKPSIISTNPKPLDEAIISASQTIEITFNRPLENVGEFKLKIDPLPEFRLELSQDRKTAKIIPTKPFELGTTYTMFIGPETKFDGVGRWGEEKVFHFKTIKYRGI